MLISQCKICALRAPSQAVRVTAAALAARATAVKSQIPAEDTPAPEHALDYFIFIVIIISACGDTLICSHRTRGCHWQWVNKKHTCSENVV